MVKDEEIMQAIANQLGKVGIKANLQFLESSVYTPRYANGEFEMAVNAWGKSLEADSVITGAALAQREQQVLRQPAGRRGHQQGARHVRPWPSARSVYQDADRLLREDAVGLFTHAQSELYGTNKPLPVAAVGLRGERRTPHVLRPQGRDRPAGWGGARSPCPPACSVSAATPRHSSSRPFSPCR